MTTFANVDARALIDEVLDRADILETCLDVDTVTRNYGTWLRTEPTSVKRLTITFVERKPEAERLAEDRSKRQTAALPSGDEVAKREAIPDDPTRILEDAEIEAYTEVMEDVLDKLADDADVPRGLLQRESSFDPTPGPWSVEPWHHGR